MAHLTLTFQLIAATGYAANAGIESMIKETFDARSVGKMSQNGSWDAVNMIPIPILNKMI